MDKLIFDEEKHKYFINGIEFISVSQLIGLFGTDFYSEQEAEKYATKNGLQKENVLNAWLESAKFGSRVHKFAEILINEGRISEIDPKDEERAYKNVFCYVKNHISNEAKSEIKVYNSEYRIAGTIDLIDNNIIYDWKNNKKISSFYYGKKMFKVINLPEHTLNKYALQLSMYRLIMGLNGIKIDDIKLLHIQEYDVVEINLNYYAKECLKMLELWKYAEFNQDKLKEILKGGKMTKNKVNVQRLGMCCNQAHAEELKYGDKDYNNDEIIYFRAKQLYYLYEGLEKELEQEINEGGNNEN